MNKWFRITLFILIAASAVVGAARFPASVTEAQGGAPILYGSTTFGMIDANTPVVNYTFDAVRGDLVEIDVQSISGTLIPAIDLLGPDQALLTHGQNQRLTMRSSDAHLASFMAQDGTYTITISGVNGSAGDYVLRLNGRPWANPTRLEYDVALDVNIAENAPVQYVDFEAGDCPTTLIVTNPLGGEPFTFPFVARVRDGSGQEVALLRGGSAQEDRVTVPANSKRYEIEVFADDPALMGMVSLLITCAQNASGCDQSGSTAAAGDLTCANCPNCGAFDRPGSSTTNICPDMDPHAVVIDPEVRGTLLTWNPVPGADAYGIHMYGLEVDGEHYLGMAGAPGDATEFMFDHLFPGYYGFRFVIEALQGDMVICAGETTVTFNDTSIMETCPEMNLRGEITSAADRSIHWSWNPLHEDFDGSFIQVGGIMPDGSGVLLLSASLPPDMNSYDTFHPVDAPATDTFAMSLQLIYGDRVICPSTAVVEFPPAANVCENFVVSAAVSPEGNVEIHWPLIAGAAGYAVNITGSDGVSLPGYPAGAAPDQDWHNVSGLAPGTYTVTVTVHAADGSVMCLSEQSFQIGGAPECANFALGVVANADGTITATWPPYPGATGYDIQLLDGTGAPFGYPLTRLDNSYSSYTFVSPGSGDYIVSLSVISAEGVAICPLQMPVTVGGGDQTPCEVIAEREGVEVRVGPGLHRTIFTYMELGRAYRVLGYNFAPDGSKWWELDKTQFPGHEAVISLWVAESDVTERGNCVDMPQVEIPDIVPFDDDDGGDGGWGPCGSCDSCGHPASECVTDPGGACVWDPGTCGGGDPDDFGDDDEPGEPGGCYTVGVFIDPPNVGNTASVQTASNCTTVGGGLPGFTSGTAITFAATPDPKWNFSNWTGCGTGGSSANPVTFTITHDCQITAHFVVR